MPVPPMFRAILYAHTHHHDHRSGGDVGGIHCRHSRISVYSKSRNHVANNVVAI